MANVIDALKRLERIGSEHSETTRKIIEAAKELSKKIASLYPEQMRERETIVNTTVEVPNNNPGPWDDENQNQRVHMMYSIRLVDDTRSLHNDYSDEFVAENRSAALKFASDIANGLLECIEQDLEKRVAEDKSGLTAISDALAALASARHSPEQ